MAEENLRGYPSCVDCGRLLPPGKIFIGVTLTPQGTLEEKDPLDQETVCEPCGRLRMQVECRIKELLIGRDPPEVDPEEVYVDLERYGVPRDITDAAARRMYSNRLRETPQGDKVGNYVDKVGNYVDRPAIERLFEDLKELEGMSMEELTHYCGRQGR